MEGLILAYIIGFVVGGIIMGITNTRIYGNIHIIKEDKGDTFKFMFDDKISVEDFESAKYVTMKVIVDDQREKQAS